MGGGVYHYTLENGEMIFREKTELDNPMYMTIANEKAYVIQRETNSDTQFGSVIVFDIAENGSLINPFGPISSKGKVPCHLSVVNSDVYVVNYLSGNVVKLPDMISTHIGKGLHPTRQKEPHTHFVFPASDDKYIMCVDLGIDSIFTYTKDLEVVSVAKVPDGYGPRHLAFSPDGEFVYCVNEIVSSVSVFFYNNGRLNYCDTYKYPLDSTKNNAASAIRIKDKYLYTSTRGADIITCFEIQGKKLRFIKNTYCGGSNPRDFLIVDDSMFVTNEFTNDVTVLKLKNGTPELTDIKLHMLKPICVVAN